MAAANWRSLRACSLGQAPALRYALRAEYPLEFATKIIDLQLSAM